MSIFDVQHQPIAHAIVQQSLLSGRLAHGLLLVGPSGVGKEMFAYRLAAMLLCADARTVKDGRARAGLDRVELPAGLAPPESAQWRDACGRCEDCRLAAAGTHPDIHLVHRELHKMISELRGRQGLELYIQVIRQFVIEPASRKSARGHGKVFIIREAHLMSDEAQNALLKTLEEPPPGTFIILLTDQAHQLLETIRSRTQLVRFAPLPVDFVRDKLTGVTTSGGRTIGPAEAAYLAGRSGGQLGEALHLAESDLFGLHQELADRLTQLTPATAIDLADWLEAQTQQLAKERVSRDEISDSQAKKEVACELLATAALVLSDAIRTSCGAADAAGPALLPAASAALAESADPDERCQRLARGVNAISRADYLIGVRFVNLRLALDEVAIELAAALAG